MATVLRTRSTWARELLAELAWPGHTLSELVRSVSTNRGQLPATASALWVSQLGYVLALQDVEPSDRVRSRVLLEASSDELGLDAFPERPSEVLAELRLLGDDRVGATAILDAGRMRADVVEGMRVDMLNPTTAGVDSTPAWLALLNTFLHQDRLQPVELDPAEPGRLMFDRLTTQPPPVVESPVQVTVAMSTFRPDQALLTAVASVLRQSWSNLELLVVDDGSGPEYEPLLRQVDQLDDRIRVIRKAVNGGTYRARNTALRQARGAVFTVLDSDDWMHPQALERSLQPLLESPDVIATRHHGVRVQNDLVITRMGYHARFVTASSLMFRTTQVLNRIGFFDTARKGADTEYARRLEAAFHTRIVDIPEVLTIARAGETLSSAEFAPRWRHGSRFAYKCLSTPWHTQIAGAAADPFLDDTTARRFPEPLRWSRPLSAAVSTNRRFDVCVAGDWRGHAGPHDATLEQIAAAVHTGLRVAVMHVERYRFMSRRDLPLCEPVLELVSSGVVELVQPDDDVDIDVLLVQGADTLEYPPHLTTPVRVGTTVVVADQPPHHPGDIEPGYAVADVVDRGRRTFGAPVLWMPTGPLVRRALEEHGLDDQLLGWDAQLLVEVPQEIPARPIAGRAEIVVGQFVHDPATPYGSTHQELISTYGFGAGYRVRFLGGTMRIRRMVGASRGTELPENWELIPRARLTPAEFFDGLDFFVHYDAVGHDDGLDRVLVEAAARGVVTIAHPSHRSVLGDLVDYAEPGDARDVVAGYVADPDRHASRSAQVRRLAAERYGYEAFTGRLRSLSPPRTATSTRVVAERARVPAPLQLTLRDRGVRHPLQVAVSHGLEAIHVALRTVADATAMDELVLIVRGRSNELSSWSQRCILDDVRPAFDPRALVSAPDVLVCGTYRVGRSVHLLTRAGWTLEGTGLLPEPTSPGTADWSWWRLDAGEIAVTLLPPRT